VTRAGAWSTPPALGRRLHEIIAGVTLDRTDYRTISSFDGSPVERETKNFGTDAAEVSGSRLDVPDSRPARDDKDRRSNLGSESRGVSNLEECGGVDQDQI
jgi:hypothetical protein